MTGYRLYIDPARLLRKADNRFPANLAANVMGSAVMAKSPGAGFFSLIRAISGTLE